MKPFAFSLMLLAQRVDDAFRLERVKSAPDSYTWTALQARKRRLSLRLRRSLFLLPSLGS
jgi:hypothetical protein